MKESYQQGETPTEFTIEDLEDLATGVLGLEDENTFAGKCGGSGGGNGGACAGGSGGCNGGSCGSGGTGGGSGRG